MQADLIQQLTRQAIFGRKHRVSGRQGIVISSHPIVSRVATDILREGGNAIDALLAAAVAQTVVEPHMSTIFGMLSILHYDAATGSTRELHELLKDFRANPKKFLSIKLHVF